MVCAVQCSSILRNGQRARHNTKLCSYRIVTEAGLPAEGTAGCMSALLCGTEKASQPAVPAKSAPGQHHEITGLLRLRGPPLIGSPRRCTFVA